MKHHLNLFGFLSSSSKAGLNQFLLSLLATTISIVLTFGTSAVLKADSLFQQAIEAQQAIAIHPEYFDSLSFGKSYKP